MTDKVSEADEAPYPEETKKGTSEMLGGMDASVASKDIEGDADHLEDDEISRDMPVGSPPSPISYRERSFRNLCCPHGASIQAIPLALCLGALTLTGFGSWSCTYFQGANIGFTGGNYGLWTIEDVFGKCQLYDVLFFAYHLDGFLAAARLLSMASMILGLAMVTTMAQALQYHIVSWTVGFVFSLLFIVSVSTTKIFNVWTIFWLFTYIIFNLIVRALFIHPVHRRISKRGSYYIAAGMILCSIFTILTLLVLKSKYCTCENLNEGDLEARVVRDPCQGETSCKLDSAGYCMVVASMFWFLTAFATQKYGVQPEEIYRDPEIRDSMYAHFPHESITTRAIQSVPKAVKWIQSAYTWGNVVDENRSDVAIDHGKPTSSRNCAQRLCCDYRIKKRSRKGNCLYWLFRVALTFLILIYTLIIVLMIGSRIENRNAEKAPDTSPYFILDPVCGLNQMDETFQTFATADQAREAGYLVAHCGECAFCSNMPDVKTYVETRKTIAISAKSCGPKAALGTHNELVDCLEDKIGFTRECTKCWAEDMETTSSSCLFTCMRTLFTGFMSNNNVPGAGSQGWLNHCFFCDEKLAGPAFVTCSGVARRRLGIQSEIERNPSQLCQKVDVDWLNYFPDS